MASPIVQDVLGCFHSAYTNDADFIVSCMFANCGVYNLVYCMSELETYDRNKASFAKIHNSYTWKDLDVVSDVLRCSFLYNTTNDAYSMICIMDDRSLSEQLKSFKVCLVELLRQNATFLSYCDMEGCGLFKFCNAGNAINTEIYIQHSKEVQKAFRTVFKKYSKVIPRCVMDLLDTVICWANVHKHTEGYMLQKCDPYRLFPCCPRYNEDVFHVALADLVYCKIDTLPATVSQLYKHAVPFYVLNELQWLITMHGEKSEEDPSVNVFYNNDAINGLTTLRAFVYDEGDNLMPMINDIFMTPFWKQAFFTLEDTNLLELYSPIHMGEVAMDVLKHVQETYLKNHKLMVFADLLGCGIYNALSKAHQVQPTVLDPLITQCKENMDFVKTHFIRHNEFLFIVDNAMKPLADALKRVERYCRYSCRLFDADDAPNYLDLIFGDVFDKDGTPTTCAICLDTSMEKRDTWFALPCNHVFHIQCLNDMCAFSDTCPCCRCKM